MSLQFSNIQDSVPPASSRPHPALPRPWCFCLLGQTPGVMSFTPVHLGVPLCKYGPILGIRPLPRPTIESLSLAALGSAIVMPASPVSEDALGVAAGSSGTLHTGSDCHLLLQKSPLARVTPPYFLINGCFYHAEKTKQTKQKTRLRCLRRGSLMVPSVSCSALLRLSLPGK